MTTNDTMASSQGACLAALRSRKMSAPQIAVAARLSVKKVIRSLAALESLGLAEKSGQRVIVWRATPRGETCSSSRSMPPNLVTITESRLLAVADCLKCWSDPSRDELSRGDSGFHGRARNTSCARCIARGT